MKKAYLILAHESPSQLQRLVFALDDGGSFFHVHVDKKSDIEEFKAIIKMECVVFLKERYDVAWGGFSMVEATMALLRSFMSIGNKCDYGILMSGKDYPLASNTEINTFLEYKKGANFIDVRSINKVWSLAEVAKRLEFYRFDLSSKKYRYVLLASPILRNIFLKETRKSFFRLVTTSKLDFFQKTQAIRKILKARKKPNIPAYGGSQWFAFHCTFISKLIEYVAEHGDFTEYHKHTHCPDEIFFHTIVQHLQALDKNIIVEQSLTYADWRDNGAHPATLSEKDYDAIKELPRRFLFARKFDADVSSEILDMIDDMRRASDLKSAESCAATSQ